MWGRLFLLRKLSLFYSYSTAQVYRFTPGKEKDNYELQIFSRCLGRDGVRKWTEAASNFYLPENEIGNHDALQQVNGKARWAASMQ